MFVDHIRKLLSVINENNDFRTFLLADNEFINKKKKKNIKMMYFNVNDGCYIVIVHTVIV